MKFYRLPEKKFILKPENNAKIIFNGIEQVAFVRSFKWHKSANYWVGHLRFYKNINFYRTDGATIKYKHWTIRDIKIDRILTRGNYIYLKFITQHAEIKEIIS